MIENKYQDKEPAAAQRELSIISKILLCAHLLRDSYSLISPTTHTPQSLKLTSLLLPHKYLRPHPTTPVLTPCYLSSAHTNLLSVSPKPNEFRTASTLFPVEDKSQHFKKWTELFDTIQGNFQARSFVLNKCFINEGLVVVMVVRFKELVELWLGSNEVGDAGAEMIATHLRKLQILSLADNKVSDRGAQCIAHNLTNTVEKLYLKGNAEITDEYVVGIIVTHTNLQGITAGNGRIKPTDPLPRMVKMLSFKLRWD